jgi:predicted anti-sigma-YlaC factor YlaD
VKLEPDCQRARLELMAALDGEAAEGTTAAASDAKQHLASCASCERWLQDFEELNRRFEGAAYPAREDLWPSVQPRLRHPAPVMGRLWVVAAIVLAWRSLQLLVDLPYPMVNLLIPLAVVVAALWQVSRDLLAVQTFAPELDKRGA